MFNSVFKSRDPSNELTLASSATEPDRGLSSGQKDLFTPAPVTTAMPRESTAAKVVRLPRDRDVHVACIDNLSFMRPFPDESFQLIVTSPPYNIGKAYERRNPLDRYLADQAQVIAECVRLLRPTGSICWQVGNHITRDGEVVPLDIVLYDVFKSFGLKLRNRIVWHFEHGLHCTKRLSGRHETILWFTKDDSYTFNADPIRVPSKYPKRLSRA